MPAIILNLPDFNVPRVEEAEHDYHVYAQVSNPPGVCTWGVSQDQAKWEDSLANLTMQKACAGIARTEAHAADPSRTQTLALRAL